MLGLLAKQISHRLTSYYTYIAAAYTALVSVGLEEDHDRMANFEAHISAVADAIAEDADVHRYFAWSLLDNFEWAWGYGKRFGIVHVDYRTQERIAKLSAHNFSKLIRAGR